MRGGNRPICAEDRAAAQRTADALNAFHARHGRIINARVCPRTATVISDLSKPEAIPAEMRKPNPKPQRPKPAAAQLQEYMEKRKGDWFRPQYLFAALRLNEGAGRVALSYLYQAGILQRRPDAVNGGRAVEYSIAKQDGAK